MFCVGVGSNKSHLFIKKSGDGGGEEGRRLTVVGNISFDYKKAAFKAWTPGVFHLACRRVGTWDTGEEPGGAGLLLGE